MKFKRQRKFHVAYQWVRNNQNGFGCITITMTGKLTETAIKEIREYIDSLDKGQKSVIMSLTELEA